MPTIEYADSSSGRARYQTLATKQNLIINAFTEAETLLRMFYEADKCA